MTKLKRILSFILSVLMMLSVMPCVELTANADGNILDDARKAYFTAQPGGGKVTLYYKDGHFYANPECTNLLAAIGTTASYQASHAVTWRDLFGFTDDCTIEELLNSIKRYNAWCVSDGRQFGESCVATVDLYLMSTYVACQKISTYGEQWGDIYGTNPGIQLNIMRPPKAYLEKYYTGSVPSFSDNPAYTLIKVDYESYNNGQSADKGLCLALGNGVTIYNGSDTPALSNATAIEIANYSLLQVRGATIRSGWDDTKMGCGVLVNGTNGAPEKSGSVELFNESVIAGFAVGIYQKTGITRFKEPTGNGYHLENNTIGIYMCHGTYIGKWTDDISCITGNNVLIGLDQPENWVAGDILMTSGYEWEYTSTTQSLYYRWAMPDDVRSLNFVSNMNPDARLTIDWYGMNRDNPTVVMPDNNQLIGTGALNGTVNYSGTLDCRFPALVLGEPYSEEEDDLYLDYETYGGTPVASQGPAHVQQGLVYPFTVTDKTTTKDKWTFVKWIDTKSLEYKPGDYFLASQKYHTLYAVWKAQVTFDANTGDGTDNLVTSMPSPIEYVDTNGTGYFIIEMPTTAPKRSGYKFKGWSTERDGDIITSDTFTCYGDTVLYAIWAENDTAVLYYNENTTDPVTNMPDPNPDSKRQNDVGVADFTVSSNVPVRQHYRFLGWYDNTLHTGTLYHGGNTYSTTALSSTLYAEWEELGKVSLMYDANGGSGAPATDTKYLDDTFTVSTQVPVWIHHTFLGWSETRGGAVKYIGGENIGQLASDKTLYAVWEEDPTAVLVYDANGKNATNMPNPLQKRNYVGNDFVVSDAIPKATGYTFLYWSLDKEGKNSAYYADDEITNDVANRTITLYAIWSAIPYTITYEDGVDGEIVFENKVYTPCNYGTATPTFNQDGTNPTRTGYTFVKWVNKDTGADWYGTVIGNATYIAVWADKTYTVTYKDGVNQTVFNNKVYGNLVYNDVTPSYDNVNHTNPVRTGYDFTGWLDENGNAPAAYVTEDKVYTAQWTAKEYTVKYVDGVGGTVFAEQSYKQKYNDFTQMYKQNGVATNTPVRDKYEFTGWTPTWSDRVTGDVTYTAQWKKLEYTIQYIDGVDGEAFATQSKKQLLGEDTFAFVGTPTRTGYTFKGWNPTVKKTVDGDATYTAQWEKIPYTVQYVDGVNGTAFTTQSQTQYYGDTTFTFVGTPTRTGYRFTGWSPAIAATVTGDATYTAQWVRVYTITYNDGVEDAVIFADKVFDGKVLNDPMPVYGSTPDRDGYIFLGWKDADGKAPAATVTEDKIFYAQWEEITNVYLIYDFGVSNLYTTTDYLTAAEDNYSIINSYDFAGMISVPTVGKDKSILYTPTTVNISEYFTVNLTYMGKTYTKKIYLLPASVTYYEAEDLITLKENSSWKLVGKAYSNTNAKTITDNASSAYGYTNASAYAGNEFAGGQAYEADLKLKVGSTMVTTDTLAFEFTGTGFDIIGACSDDTAGFKVKIYDAVTGKSLGALYQFDTYFAGDGSILKPGDMDILDYQVPVFRKLDLTYGSYRVEVTGVLQKKFSVYTNSEPTVDGYIEARVFLDGFRVYGALESDELYAEAEQDVYFKDIYDFVAEAMEAMQERGGMSGSLYVEYGGKEDSSAIYDYRNYGPQNEIYLASNDSGSYSGIGMVLKNYKSGDTVMVSARSVIGEAALQVMDTLGTLHVVCADCSASEMFYDLSNYVYWNEKLNNYSLAIVNATPNSLISLSLLKLSSNIECASAEEIESVLPIIDNPDFEPDKFDVNYESTVMKGDIAIIEAKTSTDVQYLVVKNVDGTVVMDRIDPDNAVQVNMGLATEYEFTFLVTDVYENIAYLVYAVDSEGNLSAPVSVDIIAE